MRLLSSIAMVALLSTPALAQEMKAIRSITVTGQAERKVVPDEAHVTVNISAVNLKLSAAKAEHDQKLSKVMELAKSSGIDEAQIKTQSSRVQPQYDYTNNQRNFKGYQVTTNLDLTVKKTDTLGGLLEKLTNAGLESKNDQDWQGLVNVNYTLSNPNKIRDEMASEAIANAHDKADRMAQAAGASLGGVYQISEGSSPVFAPRPMPMMMAKSMNAMAAAPVAPPAGEEEVNASVTVTYELR